MTTLTQTESTARFMHLRAYLAGAGATGALIAGAAVVLLSVATFLGFAGLPFGASGGDSGNAYLRSQAAAASTTAAALAAAPRAVAARPAPDAAAGGGAGAGSSSGPRANSAIAGASGGGAAKLNGPAPTTGTTPPPGSTAPPVCTTGCAEPPTLPGPVSSAVRGVDQTLGTNVSGSSGGLSGRVDDTASDTLNDVGGAVGSPGLGDRVAETGNRLTGGLLPGG